MRREAGITIKVTAKGKAISPDLFGVFFEDLNYAADGGLYAELIQNRSFEYHAAEQPTWNGLSFWELVQRGDGKGSVGIDAAIPLHLNNPHYAYLDVNRVGEGVGLMNAGFDGIPVRVGERYDVSLFARQRFMNDRWGPGSSITGPMPIIARLESTGGQPLGETSFEVAGDEWMRVGGTITAERADPDARFVLLAKARGGIAIDEVSLFPQRTFRNRPNGLRLDLAQAIADLKPRFVRFPGGCLVHGNGVGNFYNWKHTIGPIEQRRSQANLWGYHQSVGLGYFEYFQFCEDIGAKPLPVVAAGVSCQNSGKMSGIGQRGLPMDQMPAYVQDVLDLIEWANGPATSTWGARRATAGHPEPFNLEFLGVGNEDHITPDFKVRFKLIHNAVKQKHPEITVIGTVGPSHSGDDYEQGWAFAREQAVEVVDEHYYVPPDWFWENVEFYDRYDRASSKVYLGEYAAHDRDRRNTLRSALAEAAYMTSLERNGDVVRFASYAPLLAKRGQTQWLPDLIYFDNATVTPSMNYHVQRLFAAHAGDECLATTIESTAEHTLVATSCVRDVADGDVILKIVSRADAVTRARIDLSSLLSDVVPATRIVLTGDPMTVNEFGREPKVLPIETAFDVGVAFDYDVPAHSLSIMRFAPR